MEVDGFNYVDSLGSYRHSDNDVPDQNDIKYVKNGENEDDLFLEFEINKSEDEQNNEEPMHIAI